MLQVRNDQIVDEIGRAIRLRGACIGGWMNMENFIDGYPGAEHTLRATMADVLGPSRAHFLFERWHDYFLAEEDIAFIKACGANVVRPALNYRHFEDDARPFVYKEAGFARLDRLIGWCRRHGLYVILDMHAAQGWQSPDWHCDNPDGPALLWEHPHFQDRFVRLWEEIARRYKGNATIAAYDLLNEPETVAPNLPRRWDAINALYRRVVGAIRAIDPDHIIFLEGDGFGSQFQGYEAPFAANLAYSGHPYSWVAGGPGVYPGEHDGKRWDKAELRASMMRFPGYRFAAEHRVPYWAGEFGATFNGPPEELEDRLQGIADQIDVVESLGAHWTTWTYKDVGIMGWVHAAPESEFMQLVAPILGAKTSLAADSWGGWRPPSRALASLAEARGPHPCGHSRAEGRAARHPPPPDAGGHDALCGHCHAARLCRTFQEHDRGRHRPGATVVQAGALHAERGVPPDTPGAPGRVGGRNRHSSRAAGQRRMKWDADLMDRTDLHGPA